MRIYQGIQFDTPDLDCTVQDILQTLSEYAVRTINETYERFAFRQKKQEEGEAFDTFYNDLRVLSKACNFCSKCNDSMLRDQLVEGIRNQGTKQDLLKLQNLTRQKSVDIFRAAKKASILGQNVQPMVNCATHRTLLSRSAPTRKEELLKRGATSQREASAMLHDNACIYRIHIS